MAKKKRTYRQACKVDLANGNKSKFSKACKERFPELAAASSSTTRSGKRTAKRTAK